MSRTLVAGIDTSTQSCKVRVTDAASGELVRFGKATHPKGTSVNPQAWWDAFLHACEEAGGLDDVSALSVGGQQHGMVLLDANGAVIRDALLWNDTRSAPNADRLIEELGKDRHTSMDAEGQQLSDDPVLRGKQRWVLAVGSSPVASLTLTKVDWVARNEADNAGRIAAICLPHDWLSWRIAGHGDVQNGDPHLDALFTDRSDASGTAYFDSSKNEYRRDLLALALGDAAQNVRLPRVLAPHERGPIADPKIAGKNVPGGCVIAPGGGDNAMASLGLSMQVGDISISLGTSGVAAAISPVPAYDMSTAVTGFADATGHWLPLACTINGSRILDAARSLLEVDYDGVAQLAAQARSGADGVTLIPYFDGERTPNRPQARGSLHGLSIENATRANIARAFVEALLCSQRDCLELIKGLGVDPRRILLIGGGARSSAVRNYAPQILGHDVLLPRTDEYVAIGAARQAAWVLTHAAEPPQWPVDIEQTLSGAADEQVYEQYAHWRG
ncbi:xylulokinase [Bifidobacterium crudilactis]|jgi:xylulokinase|uniref:xylulokinase n=1 Tax=Bifidobacterium crudilactis TaxID=327277 RepID=UPI002F34F08F|nr:FGGY family carbohydrate kinase [Bifidobacterium crudilactis]